MRSAAAFVAAANGSKEGSVDDEPQLDVALSPVGMIGPGAHR